MFLEEIGCIQPLAHLSANMLNFALALLFGIKCISNGIERLDDGELEKEEKQTESILHPVLVTFHQRIHSLSTALKDEFTF